MPRMSASLAKRLADHRFAALLKEAGIIRDWPECAERSEQAALLIREAMYRRTIGRITYVQESQIFGTLAFAMPSDYCVQNETVPQ